MAAKKNNKNIRSAQRLSFAKTREPIELPNLLTLQTESFEWLIGAKNWREKVGKDAKTGLEEVFEELSPIEDNPNNPAECNAGNAKRAQEPRKRSDDDASPEKAEKDPMKPKEVCYNECGIIDLEALHSRRGGKYLFDGNADNFPARQTRAGQGMFGDDFMSSQDRRNDPREETGIVP